MEVASAAPVLLLPNLAQEAERPRASDNDRVPRCEPCAGQHS